MLKSAYRYLFEPASTSGRFAARWLFLRALGGIYFSAFFALLFQVRGLIGSQGILPAEEYLQAARSLGALRFWYAPTLFWLSSSDRLLLVVCWVGLLASVALAVNRWPRAMLLICFACFLSFVSAAQDFSGYQSDGMLLEAGFFSLFLAPAGFRPGLGKQSPPMRAAWFLLIWEWFRIYFQSGVVKLQSGDPTWRNMTALYEYYQNGPLPTWIGWYVQHLPHWFHLACAATTLIMELVLVWIAFLPGRWKILCFFVVTVWQAVVIATANYAFLNYLVLVLAVLLLEDAFLGRFLPLRWRKELDVHRPPAGAASHAAPRNDGAAGNSFSTYDAFAYVRRASAALVLTWIFYATALFQIQMLWRDVPLPTAPVIWLEPFRIANQYGLFAVMTPHRYEIEFQGSNDGIHWVAYPFAYKPQAVSERPRIYAPYQPRFDWNLWFASLGVWRRNVIVPRTEERLLENDQPVLRLFAGNPFPKQPPRLVRAVLWQYWFSTLEQKHASGAWWNRKLLGTYAPTLTRLSNGGFRAVEDATINTVADP